MEPRNPYQSIPSSVPLGGPIYNPLGQPIAAPLAISGQRLFICGERQLLQLTPPARDIYAAEPAPAPRKF